MKEITSEGADPYKKRKNGGDKEGSSERAALSTGPEKETGGDYHRKKKHALAISFSGRILV